VVTLAGEVDMSATFRLEPALEELTRDQSARRVVMDMNGVEFMDSAALGLLLATQERLQAADIRFLVANPSDAVGRLLAVAGVGDVLPITAWPPRGAS
jgi:HptB-dependent secretion and biofilm anti anti-sigma factor